MKHGFIKVAAVSPRMRVADPVFNADETIKALEEARNAGAKVIVFPELSMTGYSCGDLFLQEMLIRGAEQELLRVQDATAGHDELVMVGMPLEVNGNLYNTAAVLQDGEILAFVPKQFVPNYAEFYEKRHFTPGDPGVRMVPFGDTEVPFGCSILFDVDAVRGLSVAARRDAHLQPFRVQRDRRQGRLRAPARRLDQRPLHVRLHLREQRRRRILAGSRVWRPLLHRGERRDPRPPPRPRRA